MNGLETPVIVDDYFPTRNNQFVYAQTPDGELWVMLLEKAWAKLHGSFSRVEGGTTVHAAQQLLGSPAYFREHNEIEDVDGAWEAFKKCCRDSYIMNSSSKGGSDKYQVNGVV